MRVAVTGANGFIGSHVAERFLAAGHEVSGLVRRTSNLRWIKELPLRLVTGDLFDETSIRALCRDHDLLVHCAARTAAPSRAAMFEANVAGTASLLRLADSVGRIVFLSSQEAVGRPETIKPLTEDVPLRPITAYGESKARAEDLVRESGLPYTILRPGPVYGPRDTDVYIYFRIVDAGIRPILPGPNRVSVCAWQSLLSAIEGAAISGTNGVYFVSDGGSFDWNGLTLAIAKAMDRHPVPIRLPRFALSVAARAAAAHSALTGTVSILNSEKLRMLDVENLTVSNEAARRDLRLEPAVTGEALRLTANWYRGHGWLKRI